MTRNFTKPKVYFVAVARTVIPNHRRAQQRVRRTAVEHNVTKLPMCGNERESGQKAAPTNGREERMSGCRYVDLSYIAHVEYPKHYGSDLP
jgi:hypothetical protein